MSENIKVLLIDQIANVNFRYTFPLVNALAKCGVDVTLITDGKENDDRCQCRKIKLFNTSDKSISRFKKLINYFAAYWQIIKMVKIEHFDVIHTQWFNFSPLDYLALYYIKISSNIKYVATVHDILPFNRMFYDKFFHKGIYKVADSIIVQEVHNIEKFGGLFPDSEDKLVMIPHGHMLDFIEKENRDICRQKLDIPKEKKVFLFFGQIKKVKGVELFLNAFAKARESCPDIYALIAGNIWKTDFDECENIIREQYLQDIVRTDIRYISDDEVKTYFGAADVCVLPYLDVYQSGVVQLAYGYEKAVVVSDLPAFTQFVVEGQTGFVSQVGDVNSLSEALVRAYNCDYSDEIGLRGKQTVCERLDWQYIAKEIYEQCYQKELNEK